MISPHSRNARAPQVPEGPRARSSTRLRFPYDYIHGVIMIRNEYTTCRNVSESQPLHAAGARGTSRPIQYTALLDENDFSADELQVRGAALSWRCSRAAVATGRLPPDVSTGLFVTWDGHALA
eukprot:COSAG01_NODE_724_length_14056_cov_41.795443_15_plen_123_part_00